MWSHSVGAMEGGDKGWEINGGAEKKKGRSEMVRDGRGGRGGQQEVREEEREKCVHQADVREKLGDCRAVHSDGGNSAESCWGSVWLR